MLISQARAGLWPACMLIIVALVALKPDIADAQPAPVQGDVKIRGVTRTGTIWGAAAQPAQTVDVKTVDFTTVTVKQNDTVTGLMVEHGLRTDPQTLQTVIAVNPAEADLAKLKPGTQILLPDIPRDPNRKTMFELEYRPELTVKALQSINRFNENFETIAKTEKFNKVDAKLRLKISLANAAASDLTKTAVRLSAPDREKLQSAVDDLDWTLSRLAEREGMLRPNSAPRIRKADWRGAPWAARGRFALVIASNVQSDGPPLLQLALNEFSVADLIEWIAGSAAHSIEVLGAIANGDPTHKFDMFVHTIANDGQKISNLEVCLADADPYRRRVVQEASRDSRSFPRLSCDQTVGDVSSPAIDHNIIGGHYLIWARQGTHAVSCVRRVDVLAGKRIVDGRPGAGFRLRSDLPLQEAEDCRDPR